jgi:hypothetical protein
MVPFGGLSIALADRVFAPETLPELPLLPELLPPLALLLLLLPHPVTASAAAQRTAIPTPRLISSSSTLVHREPRRLRRMPTQRYAISRLLVPIRRDAESPHAEP